MHTTIEPTPIVSLTRPQDVALSMIFDPTAPLASIDIAVDAPVAPTDHTGYLATLDAAIMRLCQYRGDFAAVLLAEMEQ